VIFVVVVLLKLCVCGETWILRFWRRDF